MKFLTAIERMSAVSLSCPTIVVEVTEPYARRVLHLRKDQPLVYQGLRLQCVGSKAWRERQARLADFYRKYPPKPKTQRRQVIESRFVPNRYGIPGRGAKHLTLECGHVLIRRNSDAACLRMRCKQCESP